MTVEPQRLRRADGELRKERLFRRALLKRPGQITGKARQNAPFDLRTVLHFEQQLVVADDLRHRKVDEEGEHFLRIGKLRRAEFARRDVRPRDRISLLRAIGAGEIVVLLFVEQIVLDDRPRGHDADDVPIDHPLAFLGIGKLFADGDLFAHRHEAGDVGIRRVEGNAAHGRALFQPAIPARQREIEQFGDADGVVEEHLVKVAQAVEHHAVLVFLLHLKVVLHHR